MDKRTLKTKKIGVLLGGKSSERDISLKSGNAVLQGLKRSGYKAIAIDASKNLIDTLKKEKIQVAFIALHGRWGEDGTVQGLLEMMGIPYTGSGVLGSSMAIDKTVMKLIFATARIPTPKYTLIYNGEGASFPLPYVVKPANEGSSVGISVVKKKQEAPAALKEALKYDSKILIEEFVKGQEITVAVINNNALPVIEVRPKSGFYNFEAKYEKGKTEYIVPAEISSAMAKKASDIALIVYTTFNLSGSARIDMLIKDKTPLVIDINTSPGMTETSLVPKAWAYTGRTFDELVEEILLEAALKV
jgi:D-alanine-D-alanine ligase